MVTTMYRNDTSPILRDTEGRKMYPGRFWEWPEGIPGNLDTHKGRMEYGLAIWTETNTNMPTARQIKYALFLLGSRKGADPDMLDWSSKKFLGRAINEMLKLAIR